MDKDRDGKSEVIEQYYGLQHFAGKKWRFVRYADLGSYFAPNDSAVLVQFETREKAIRMMEQLAPEFGAETFRVIAPVTAEMVSGLVARGEGEVLVD